MFDNPFFSVDELKCPCCNTCSIDDDFLKRLISIRTEFNQPMKVNSGFRCIKHNAAIGGEPNSAHSKGKAVDIKCAGRAAYQIIELAIGHGMTGIGISQRLLSPFESRFVHMDCMTPQEGPRPFVWSYK